MANDHIHEILDDFLDAGLDAEQHRSAEQHLSDCAECRAELEAARKLRAVLSAMPVSGPREGFFDNAMRQAKTQNLQSHASRRGKQWMPAAIAAGLAVMLVGGLLLRSPQPPLDGRDSVVASVTMELSEPQTVNLVFNSATVVEDVLLVVDLPMGVELAAYPGRMQIRWATSLQAGNNRLPLELIAVDGMGGEIVATLRSEGTEKVFRIDVEVFDG